MADAAPTPEATPDADPAPDASTDTPLGPEGEKALQAFKERAREAERKAKQAETQAKQATAELEQLRTASMSEQERAVATARAEGRAEALKVATERLLKAEVRALAAGVLADPDDAIHLLDLSSYEPDSDGGFDSKAIQADLKKLVAAKPYLSPAPGNGASEGGPRGDRLQQPLGSDPLEQTLRDALGIN